MNAMNSKGVISPRASMPAPNQATTEIVPNRTKMMKDTKSARTFAPLITTPRYSPSADP